MDTGFASMTDLARNFSCEACEGDWQYLMGDWNLSGPAGASALSGLSRGAEDAAGRSACDARCRDRSQKYHEAFRARYRGVLARVLPL